MAEITDSTPTAIQLNTIRVMSDAGPDVSREMDGVGDVFRERLIGRYGAQVASPNKLYDFFINNIPDPDTALAANPDADEIIASHPDVRACMIIRSKTVSGLPMRIDPATEQGDDPLCEKLAAYVKEIITSIPNLDLIYEEMVNGATILGGQGHEYIWQMRHGYPAPVEANPVHKTRFTFDVDKNMALLTRVNPVWGEYVGFNPQANFPVDGSDKPLTPVYFPRGKFTYHVYGRGLGGTWTRTQDEGYLSYGKGEDTALYIPVTFDNFVLRFQVKWLEKFGIPLAILHWNPGYAEASAEAIGAICESIRGESSVRIPFPGGGDHLDEWYNLDFKEPTGTGYQAFGDFRDRYTSAKIQNILLGGSSQLGQEGGGYAADVSKKDFGPQVIFHSDCRRINNTFNKQLIPAIVLARFPNVPMKYMPSHCIEPKEEVDQEMQMSVAIEAAQAVGVPESHFYKIMGIAAPKPGEKTVFLGMGMDEGGEGGGSSGGGRIGGRQGRRDNPDKRPSRPIGKGGNSKGLRKEK